MATTTACDQKPDPSGPLAEQRTQLEAASAITLRANNGQYLSAENGGGAGVRADRGSPGAWEIFTLIDENGGALESGDRVFLRSANGMLLQAENGGGGALRATGVNRHEWETFRIHKEIGAGAIRPGDAVGVQAHSGHLAIGGDWGGAQGVDPNVWPQQLKVDYVRVYQH